MILIALMVLIMLTTPIGTRHQAGPVLAQEHAGGEQQGGCSLHQALLMGGGHLCCAALDWLTSRWRTRPMQKQVFVAL